MPPAATPRMATAMITANSGIDTAMAGSVGIEGIERHRHEMAVGDRKDDEDEAQGNDDQRREKLSHDHLSQ